MKPAFWDSSALVPLCVQQKTSPVVRRWVRQYSIVVWWSTSVEVRSAIERLLRAGEMSQAEHVAAGKRLDQLRHSWRELQSSETLRAEAESLLSRFPLRAADALQLAAALTWAVGHPRERHFISGDLQLLEAARQLGFQVVEA